MGIPPQQPKHRSRGATTMSSDSLAEFELLVMLAALRLGDQEAYTVSIANDIEERTGRSVRRANVYTTLQRLEKKDLVSTRLGEARPERGGKPRRLVKVESAGLRAVRATTGAISSMVGGLGEVIGVIG
jgi:DNA-binding PadR family transcriptional regulator